MSQPELIERRDGTVALQTNADPAGAGHQILGWRRYSVGLDVGGRGDDPSALCIVKSESLPYMTGKGWQQALTSPKYTVVYTETARIPEATDLVDWMVKRLQQLKNWRFSFDSTGLGAPLTSLFEQANVEANSVTMTAGNAINRKGNLITCSKNLMLENAATCFENGTLQIAHDLPDRESLINEIVAVEVGYTSAGNPVLKSSGRGHHSDRFIALSLALLAETHIAPQSFTTTKLTNYW